MSDTGIIWKMEFEAMGAARVRAALIAGRWERAKQMAAREWLERSDAQAWQSRRNIDEPSSVPLLSKLRQVRWLALVGGAAALFLGAARLLRMF